METKSVKQIANELGTNKNKIYRIIQKFGIEPYTEPDTEPDRKNATVYTIEDFETIRAEFIRLQNTRRDTPEDKEENNTSPDLESLIESQRATIEKLERDLENSRQTENQLRELLANQMELLRQSQEMNANLTDTIRREQEIRAIKTLAIETKDKPKLLERISAIFHPNKSPEPTPEE